MNIEKTIRGFPLGKFKDRYDKRCSIQQSSLADENCIWLGVDDPEPLILASKAAQFGVKTNECTGWVPYPIPDEVLLHTRMHLNEEQVRNLIDVLQRWVDTGEL